MTSDVVVLWGLRNDGPLDRVYRHLQLAEVPVLVVDQQDVFGCTLDLAVADRVGGMLRTPHFSLDIDRVGALYVRPYDLRQSGILDDCDPAGEESRQAARFEESMYAWAEIAACRVISRPSAAGSNNSKPYQMALIRQCGFRVPDTILTTDPRQARDYFRDRKRVIYKSISSQRSIVAELTDQDDHRFDDVKWCPTQFQEYVEGVDHRVHVLGERLFVSRIRSDSADYRYDGDTRIETVELPDDVADKCLALSKSLGLAFSGIDLRLSPDGSWTCFEVNPSPGYTYFENAEQQPISAALAKYLAQSLQGAACLAA